MGSSPVSKTSGDRARPVRVKDLRLHAAPAGLVLEHLPDHPQPAAHPAQRLRGPGAVSGGPRSADIGPVTSVVRSNVTCASDQRRARSRRIPRAELVHELEGANAVASCASSPCEGDRNRYWRCLDMEQGLRPAVRARLRAASCVATGGTRGRRAPTRCRRTDRMTPAIAQPRRSRASSRSNPGRIASKKAFWISRTMVSAVLVLGLSSRPLTVVFVATSSRGAVLEELGHAPDHALVHLAERRSCAGPGAAS